MSVGDKKGQLTSGLVTVLPHIRLGQTAIAAVVVGAAAIAPIGVANPAPMAPTDYFVGAESTVLNQTVSTGGIAGPLASITFPDDYVYYEPLTEQYGTCSGGPGGSCAAVLPPNGDGVLAAEGAAAAAANLATGQLHAAAGATALYNGFDVGFPASATAAFGDTLYFVNPSASPTTFTTIGFTAHVDGTQNVGYNNGGANFAIGVGPGEFGTPAPFGFSPTSAMCSASVTTNCVYNGYGTSADWPGYDATVNQNFAGTFTFKGPAAAVPIFMELVAQGQYGFTDFSDTATFSFDALPDGVSYTSASESFLSTAPAPLIDRGLAVLVAAGGLLFGPKLLELCKKRCFLGRP